MTKPPKTIKQRDLLKILKRYGVKVVKGSSHSKHLVLDNDQSIHYPFQWNKTSDDIHRTIIESIRRRFKLTPEDGVSDDAFYRRK